ncbi:Dam family site-specific DNA-(adenine-N6)-methyltransferase [Neptuniibacter sp. CAU 1671]|uniref:DNA adenine methylase n=1 Tax=Neptuniibacter sp. CAU 1671 TaxID=3032593 RepID=UPI0023DCC17E|nr:Dam family site-specific DNA-(adenine-N6)-methyltransferase [Neptuniibacter sp. CAU 1671]MDF2180966.1 Dam family site-specific DNA-(adenine-N6)-methyltransferase [Neptuniibacter sp. CAU 1671]
MDQQSIKNIPFLKWAGGKRWFTEYTNEMIPPFSGRYIEPFLGSGAVYFHLSPDRALLSDSNKELIETYQAIKESWESVQEILQIHHSKHCKEYYYAIRSSQPGSIIESAAKFIYLNRTCWNGLYRVNLKGEFNVPIGTKTNVLLSTDNFANISSMLKTAEIRVSDFEDTIETAKADDFIFVDPPYTVKHNHNGFIKYNENLFSWDDQVRLKESIDRATARGVKVLVTNAAHASIEELYQDYSQRLLNRNNVLSGKAQFRGKYEELIIQCW